MAIRLVALDADDTLWHHETYFQDTQRRLRRLLESYAPAERIDRELGEVERRNLAVYGYGVKGFTLSMIETALTISGGRMSGTETASILAMGRDLLGHPVEPLPGVEDALLGLKDRVTLVLLTKGDLFHQEAKLAASGLGDRFSGVEIVSEKTPAIYARVFARYGVPPAECLMAGNSLRSDILPVLECGAYAAHIPYPLVWSHEAAEAPHGHSRFREFASLAELPQWLDELAS